MRKSLLVLALGLSAAPAAADCDDGPRYELFELTLVDVTVDGAPAALLGPYDEHEFSLYSTSSDYETASGVVFYATRAEQYGERSQSSAVEEWYRVGSGH